MSAMKSNFPTPGWTFRRCYDVRDEDPRTPLQCCDFCRTEIRYVYIFEHSDGRYAEIGSECARQLEMLEEDRYEMRFEEQIMRKRGSSRLIMMSDTHWLPAYGSETALRKIHRGIDYIIEPTDDGFRASYKLHIEPESVRLKIKTHDVMRARHALFNVAEARIAPWRAQHGIS